MSRALVASVLAAALLAGCASRPPAQVVDATVPEIVQTHSLVHWLELEAQVSQMSAEQAAAALAALPAPAGADQTFYFGLLNQRMPDHEAWIQARDAFRGLRQDEQLGPELRQLSGLLEQSCQHRINWQQRYSNLQARQDELQQQLRQAEQETRQMQQKIQALTELEQDISTRREQ